MKPIAQVIALGAMLPLLAWIAATQQSELFAMLTGLCAVAGGMATNRCMIADVRRRLM